LIAVQVDRLRDSGEDVPVAEEPDAKDSRSPIERFRTPPKKPLSVTDLISPAWCELQYWYSLTKYGRIKRTPAMKQGSKIHKQMEEQVHTEVPVQVATKEDKLGLRIWNVIQGLRTLRSTGLTRELEVFGTVEGELIIGIIDEISYNCPDEQLEAKILDDDGDGGGDGSRSKKTTKQDAHQHTLHSFLADSRAPVRPLYILDIKTRKSKTLPALGSRMRPTQMQLMLYRRLLDDLAANRVDADQVFARYGVDADASFSDVFIAALGAIDFQPRPRPRRLLELDDADDEVTAPSSSSPTVDPLDEILSHNTLASLWSYMIAEFAQTIPINEVSSALSPLLTAEFRNSDDGRVIGQRSFAFDAEVLDQYVSSEMRWWRGERETRGVEIEEAYKCGMCEFADGCTWRKSKVDEGVKKARLRNQTRARSRV
jgi:exonuclease V